MRIFYSPHFLRSYKKLPKEIQLLAEKREDIFRENWKALELETHKLKGLHSGFWAFSINHRYRIIFDLHGDDVRFHEIGTHDIYD
jgi:addiction module RelE/StbE family toxin